MKANAKRLGKLYAEIWWAHDKKNYNLVEKKYVEMCRLIGINIGLSKKIALHVKLAYKNSDVYENSSDFFDKCLSEFLGARRSIGLSDNISFNQIKWWIAFRKKKYLSVAFFVFKQQRAMFQRINLNTFLSTYYFIRSGFSHNQRNKKETSVWLAKYWNCFLEELPKLNIIPMPI